MSTYFCQVAEYYRRTKLKDINKEQIVQAKRCLLDLVGCMLAATQNYEKVTNWILSLDNGRHCCIIPGTTHQLSAPLAAFVSSTMASALELDDATSIGASVHPGSCVIPAALAMAQQQDSTGEQLIHSIIFGYDLCNRLGLMSSEYIREMGLHGPGLLSAACASATAGMLAGLSMQQLESAFSIALSLSPLCPFSSFTDGADVKGIYVSWGVYLGMLSVDMAQNGLTGPRHIMQGEFSLKRIFASNKGKDKSPQEHSFSTDIIFKDYSACLSVHPTMTVLESLLKEHSIEVADIESVKVETYPYAYELSTQVSYLTPVSARLYLPFTVAVMIYEGRLDPSAFTPDAFVNEKYRALMKKVLIFCHDEYGRGPFGTRGSIVTIHMKSGEIFKREVCSAKWSSEAPPTEEELVAKFHRITNYLLTSKQRNALLEMISEIDRQENLKTFFQLLSK